jgi:ribose 5-phosphate isomerase A
LSYDDAIKALSSDALKFVKDDYVIGLGSGRAATALVKSLSKLIKLKGYNIRGVPTSLQIKLIAEKGGIPLVEADQVEHIDVVFDGADQIEKKVVVMADKTKFVKNFTRTVPVEIHPLARNSVTKSIKKLGGDVEIRSLDRGYPFFTENGNIILDCDFGTIKNPKVLTQKIKQTAGVLESGIFLRKPDMIYKAKENGKYDIL